MEKQPRILIIDDDIDVVEAMKIILESNGYCVSNAFGIDDDLRIVRESSPDLIILDVVFSKKGDISGLDYAEKLRRDKSLSHIPILLVTSMDIHDSENLYLSGKNLINSIPIDDFISKPPPPEELLQKTENLLKMKMSKWAGK